MPANAPRENTLPLDPNVKMPAAVMRASQAADAAHAQRYNPPDPNAPPAAAPPADAPAAPQPAPSAFAPQLQNGQQSQNVPPMTGHVPVPETGSGDSWENRFRASEGRLRKANEALTQQATTINEMNVRMQGLEGMVANFQQAPPLTPQGNPPGDVTPEERETWGEDFMGMVRKLAAEQVAGERQMFQQEINQLRAQLGGVTTHVVQNDRDKMMGQLDAELPDWRTQNRDPDFLGWLNLQDPYSGAIRSVLLKDAWEKNIASRVLSIFKGYLTEGAATQSAYVAPAPAPNGGRPSLADFAAPGRAKTEAPPVGGPSAKPNISRAEIAAFYADVRANRYRGRDQEKNTRENEIFAAEREGRIIN